MPKDHKLHTKESDGGDCGCTPLCRCSGDCTCRAAMDQGGDTTTMATPTQQGGTTTNRIRSPPEKEGRAGRRRERAVKSIVRKRMNAAGVLHEVAFSPAQLFDFPVDKEELLCALE